MGIYRIPAQGCVWVEADSVDEALKEARKVFGEHYVLQDTRSGQERGVLRAEAHLIAEAIASAALSPEEAQELSIVRRRLRWLNMFEHAFGAVATGGLAAWLLWFSSQLGSFQEEFPETAWILRVVALLCLIFSALGVFWFLRTAFSKSGTHPAQNAVHNSAGKWYQDQAEESGKETIPQRKG